MQRLSRREQQKRSLWSVVPVQSTLPWGKTDRAMTTTWRLGIVLQYSWLEMSPAYAAALLCSHEPHSKSNGCVQAGERLLWRSALGQTAVAVSNDTAAMPLKSLAQPTRTRD